MSLRISLFLGDRLKDQVLGWFAARGAHADVCVCLEDCLERLGHGKADVVMVDGESCPDGIGVAESMKRAGPRVSVVFVSEPGDRSPAPPGADGAVEFPFVQEELDRILASAAAVPGADQGESAPAEIRELWEISKAVASTLGTGAILDKIVESAIRVTMAESGSVMLVADEPETLYVAAARGGDAENRRNKSVHFDHSVAGWVARTGEPLLIQGGLANDERFRHLPPARVGIRSSLCVPIKAPLGKMLGVLSLNVERTAKYFTVRDLHVITIYSSEAAAIIESARAFGELQAANERLKKTNEKLKAIQAQLVESSKMAAVGLLASGIAHEFNNLLTGILGMAQLAAHTKKDKHIWKSIEVSEDNSQKAKEIIKNLLKFSGRYKKIREKSEIAPLVEEVLSLMVREFDKEGIEIRKEFDAAAVAPVNRSEIQQVVLNLLINAKQAITGMGKVTLGVAQDEKDVVISVEDTGCGIPDENLSRIFEPFFSTKSLLGGGENEGTGLGLSVSWGIVKGHGGEIGVRSKAGSGSCFTVKLPKNPKRTGSYTDSIPVQGGKSEAAGQPAPGSGKDVLIIDDEWWIREFMKETFEDIGYKVLTAGNGAEGLQTIAEQKPSLVFLDLVMPGCRGEDVAAEILARFKDVRLVLMTGKFESLESIEKSINRGIFAYLAKPFDVQDIYNLLSMDSPK